MTVVGFFLLCGTSQASFVIDDFGSATTGPNGSITSTFTSFSGGAHQATTSVAGTMFSVTYDFGGQALAAISGLAPGAISALTIPSTPLVVGDWDLAISSTDFTTVNIPGVGLDPFIDIDSVAGAGALAGATDLTLKWTFTDTSPGAAGGISYGAPGQALSAIPEPVTAASFIVGMTLISRRRRS